MCVPHDLLLGGLLQTLPHCQLHHVRVAAVLCLSLGSCAYLLCLHQAFEMFPTAYGCKADPHLLPVSTCDLQADMFDKNVYIVFTCPADNPSANCTAAQVRHISN
jgi:hypothetical protein